MRFITLLALTTLLAALMNALEHWPRAFEFSASPEILGRAALNLILSVLALGCALVVLSLRLETKTRVRSEERLKSELAERYGVSLASVGEAAPQQISTHRMSRNRR